MSAHRFVYVTYIRTTPEKLWQALTAPEFTRQYWAGCWFDADWREGGDWKLMIPDGRIGDAGEVPGLEMTGFGIRKSDARPLSPIPNPELRIPALTAPQAAATTRSCCLRDR